MKIKDKKTNKLKKYTFIFIINILIFFLLISISFNKVNASFLSLEDQNSLIVKGNGYNKSLDIPDDGDFKNRTNWMTRHVFDHQQLGEISMPGTHDSAAYEVYGFGSLIAKSWTKTQDTNIENQLKRGIRYFDFRTREDFNMYHGPFKVAGTLTEHLDTVINFLKKYPKEFVIIRLKNEEGDSIKLKDRLENDIFSKAKYSNYIVKHGLADSRVDKVRGKILILNDAANYLSIDAPNWRGIPRQDQYKDVDADQKFNHIKQEIKKIEDDLFNFIHVNHISYTKGTSTVYKIATDMNKRFEDYLKDYSTPKNKLSISVLDYPNDSLIDEILKRNHRYFLYKLSTQDLIIDKGSILTNKMIRDQIKGIDHEHNQDVDKYELSYLPKTDTTGIYNISIRVYYIDRTFSTLKLKVYVKDENQDMTYFTNGIEVGKNDILVNNLPNTTSNYKLRFYPDKLSNPSLYRELELRDIISQGNENKKNYVNINFSNIIFKNRLIYPYSFIPANATFELYKDNQILSSYKTRDYLFFKKESEFQTSILEEGKTYINLDNILDNGLYSIYLRRKNEINADALKEIKQFRKRDLKKINNLNVLDLNIKLHEGDEISLKQKSNGQLDLDNFIETIIVSKNTPKYLLFKQKYFDINNHSMTIFLPNLLDKTINLKEEEIKEAVKDKLFKNYKEEFGNIYYTVDKRDNTINASTIKIGTDTKKYRTLKLYINFDDELLNNNLPDIDKSHIVNITLKSDEYKMAQIFKIVMKQNTVEIDIDDYDPNYDISLFLKEYINIKETFKDENNTYINDNSIIDNTTFKLQEGQNIVTKNDFVNSLKVIALFPDKSISEEYGNYANFKLVFKDEKRYLINEIDNKYAQLVQKNNDIKKIIEKLSQKNAVVKLNDKNDLERKIEELKTLKEELINLIEKEKPNKDKYFGLKSQTRKKYIPKLSEINTSSINIVVNDNNNNGVVDEYENQAIVKINKLKQDVIKQINSFETIKKQKRNKTIERINNLYNEKQQNIKKATSKKEVDKIKNTTIKEINKIFNQLKNEDINNIKNNIKNNIESLFLEKNNQIDNLYLNKNTKQNLKIKLNNIKDSNFDKLKNISNKDELLNLKEETIREINSININKLDSEELDKDKAILEIKNYKKEKEDEINNTSLSLNNKQKFLNDLNEKVKVINQNIQKSKSPEDLNIEKDKGTDLINKIIVPKLDLEESDKDKTILEIKTYKKEKEEEINNIYALKKDKEKIIDFINHEYEETIKLINSSKKLDDVIKYKNNFINNLKTLKINYEGDETKDKQNANNELEQAFNIKIKEIDDLKLNEKAKQKIKEKLEIVLKFTSTNIFSSKTPEDLLLKKEEGINEFDKSLINLYDTLKENYDENLNKKINDTSKENYDENLNKKINDTSNKNLNEDFNENLNDTLNKDPKKYFEENLNDHLNENLKENSTQNLKDKESKANLFKLVIAIVSLTLIILVLLFIIIALKKKKIKK